MKNLLKRKKGFTLIELIVVMAVIGILVLLAAPKFMGHTKEAKFTKLISDTKVLETASERYYMDHQEWPRLSDEPYSAEEIEAFAQKIYDTTGKTIELDTEGKYYDIDYSKLSKYVNIPDSKESYIIQNPVGNIYALEGLTQEAKVRLDVSQPSIPEPEVEVPLYEFSTATFTNAGATGRYGPTQAQLNTAYIGLSLEGNVISSNGIQLWTVPKTGNYKIDAYGASGDNNSRGAIISGTITLTKGEQVKILVGQKGSSRSGGGGTFVVKFDNTPLIIAGGGGGGGAGVIMGYAATTANSGVNGYLETNGGKDGNAGGGHGGAGFIGDNTIDGSKSFINGGVGGYYYYPGTDRVASSIGIGGFGGGGAGQSNAITLPSGGASFSNACGGGGGYSGGGGGKAGSAYNVGGSGGGGGSYITSTAINISTSDGKYENELTFNGQGIENLNNWNLDMGKVVVTYTGQ